MKYLLGIILFISLSIPLIKGYAYLGSIKQNQLTLEEQIWLTKHDNVIIIPQIGNNPPMFFIKQDGNKAGMAYDFISLIQKRLKINVKLIILDSWTVAAQKYQDKEFDVIFGFHKTEDRSHGFYFTEPFIEIPYVIVVRNSFTGEASLDQLAGKTVSVVEGYLFHKIMKERYPEIIIDPVKSELEGLRHVAYRISDGFAVNQFYALYIIEHHGLANLKFGSETGFVNKLAIAVRKDQPLLFSIMQKGLASISERERKVIIRKWYNIKPALYDRPEFWYSISILIILSLGILIGIIIWNRTLRKRVQKQTGEIQHELILRKKAEDELRGKNEELALANIELKSAVEQLEETNQAFEAINNDLVSTQLEVIKSENMLKSIFRVAPTGIGMVQERTIKWCNDLFCSMTGYSMDEIVGTNTRILYPDQEEYEDVSREMFLQNREIGTGTVETRWKTKEGHIIDVLLNATPFDQKNQSLGITFTVLDITERKKVERELRESEERFRKLIMRTPISMVLVDDKLNVIMVNEKFTSLFGYDIDEVSDYKTLYIKLIHDESTREKLIRDHADFFNPVSECISQECIALCKDGSARVIDIEEAHLQNGRIISLIDMTAYRNAERAIRANLREKELLLKEIHHRVKNNMQVISSLLHLQMDYIKDPADVELFKKSESRIRTMALVHESLYKSDNLSSIDFEPFILGLIDNLFDSFKVNRDRISVEIKVDNVSLGIDRAIPCSQIINELIMNSLKYAFPGDDSGHIKINFYLQEGAYHLIIADDGIGMPEDIDLKNIKTLGLQIVFSLVEQIKGIIKLEGPPGSCFNIMFRE